MYNHIRNLLVNRTGSDYADTTVPGDELIPTGYVKKDLPTYLQNLRGRIFGVSPDRVMLNYRTAQLLTTIASTDLQQYVTSVDSRITYDYADLKSGFGPSVEKQSGLATDELTLQGSEVSPDASGVCSYRYIVSIEASPTAVVTVKRTVVPEVTEDTAITLTNGLSQQISLPYSGLKFRLNSTTDGASWYVQGALRPTTNLSSIVDSLESVGEPVLLQLFGPSPEKPYDVFKECWENHPELAYRLGGIALAIAYRTDEV